MDEWRGPGGYRGGAVKIGAGVQGAELMQKAHENGVAVVVGECPVRTFFCYFLFFSFFSRLSFPRILGGGGGGWGDERMETGVRHILRC